MVIYIIHLHEPMAHAQHYVGIAKDEKERLQQHRTGHGARMLAAAIRKGIRFRIAQKYTVSDDKARNLERWIKSQKNSWRFCPICTRTRKQKQLTLSLTF